MNSFGVVARFDEIVEQLTRRDRDSAGRDLSPIMDREEAEKVAMSVLRRDMTKAIAFQRLHRELAEGEHIRQEYFITIRPNEAAIDFAAFRALVNKFLARKCFVSYTMVFEQKGESAESLGTGFHAHILASMTQTAKGQVLRDTTSTFKHCTATNCVQVDTVKTAADAARVRGYILEHRSQDGHKEPTAEWDARWRTAHGIQAYYSKGGASSPSAPPSNPLVDCTSDDLPDDVAADAAECLSDWSRNGNDDAGDDETIVT